ncbi:MAG: phytanoyl-CoA dioxygenase family protein [Cyanobacteria bacterium P01_C01_bin.72]
MLLIRNKYSYSLKLAFLYTLSRFKLIHNLLPSSLKNQLPVGWNFKMFWTAFISGGERFYIDYFSRLKQPENYLPKVSVAEEFKLTEEDIKFFHENGYIGPFDLVSPEEAESLVNHVRSHIFNTESVVQGEYKQLGEENNNDVGVLPTTNNKLENTGKKYFSHKFSSLLNRHLDDSTIGNLVQSPAIIERCAQLIGSDLLLWRSAFFEVNGNTKGTLWHQSSNRIAQNMRESVVTPPNPNEIFQLTCWIALTDANEYNGAMHLIPGTHKEIYPLKLDKTQTLIDQENAVGGNYSSQIDYPADSPATRIIPMKAGQFFLFSERVIHGSVDNVTDEARLALNCRYVTTNTRVYTPEMLQKGHQNLEYNIKNLDLSQWHAILVRGEDHFGYNKIKTPDNQSTKIEVKQR